MARPHENLDRAARIITPEIALGLLDALNVGLLLVDRSGSIIHRNQTAAALLPAGRKLDEILTQPPNDSLAQSGAYSAHDRMTVRDDGTRLRECLSAVLSNEVESAQSDTAICVTVADVLGRPNTLRVRMLPLIQTSNVDEARVVVLVDRFNPTNESGNSNAGLSSVENDRGTNGASATPSPIPGETAARVAHELNNPIDAILRYINLAIRLSENVSEPKLHDYLAQSRSGLMRMVEIVSDMLIGPITPSDGAEPLDIRTVIDDAVRTHLLAAESARVEVSLEVANGNIHPRYGTRLYQICTNLIRNAIDAMPRGGRLTITATREHDEEAPEDHGRDWFVIRVSDTGVGLPEDVNRVFASFYTTKHPAHGAGLGLSICREYAEAMGGTIEARHGETGGAVFTVTLPGSLLATDDNSSLSSGSLLRAWAAKGP